MKSRRWITGLLFSFLTASVGVADPGRSVPVTTSARTASRSQQSHRVVAFKTERTDSWLCSNVSALFCTDLMPKLSTSPDPAINFSAKVPDRSRKN